VGSTAAPSENGLESDHFSDDAFEDADADEDEASFDASAVSAGVVSDRGSEASLTFAASAPAQPPTSAAVAASAEQLGELANASASRKLEIAGATNASISYDEDFEAVDPDEEDTLGASIGGA